MLKVGLTGGIASGKTSIAKWFAEQGITVFDADKTVHELFSAPSVAAEIELTFGSGCLEDGKVNRKFLANIIFKDRRAKDKLEEMIHPFVLREMQKICAQAARANEDLIILDIPLLFEIGWDKLVDEVWVVYVPRPIQLQRLMLRNGLTEEESGQRIASQMPLEEKVKKADKVIDNSGSWIETEKKLEAIRQELRKKA